MRLLGCDGNLYARGLIFRAKLNDLALLPAIGGNIKEKYPALHLLTPGSAFIARGR